MPKNNVEFICGECGHRVTRQMMKCLKCNAFNSFQEAADEAQVEKVKRSGLKSSTAIAPVKRAQNINSLNQNPIKRTPTGISELDRVLGGGFVDGEVILFAGSPGAGKSTMCLEIAECFSQMGQKVLYSSGEESEQQIGLRAKRMQISGDNILIINETNLETIFGHIEAEKPDLLIVDSLQTVASSEISGSIGSIAQSKEAAHALTRLAKEQNIKMILISQIVKGGD